MSEFILVAYTEQEAEVCRQYSNMQELVRCKDCKQGKQSVLPNRHLWCRIHEFYREPKWFCADGVKKDD